MKMQDKELDDIFRSQLEGLEAEPAERVWTGIDAELDSSSHRKIWILAMRVAAVLAVVVTVGLFFVLKRDKVAGDNDNKAGIVKNHMQPAVQQSETGEPVKISAPEVAQVVVKTPPPANPDKNMARVSFGRKNQSDAAKTQPVQNPEPATIKQDEPIAIAQVSPPIEIKEAVVPNNDVPLTAKLPDESKPTFKTQLVAIAQITSPDSAKKPKRRGIHSFGDLVNLVANKADKQRAVADDDDESIVAMVSKRVQKIKADREQQEQAK